MKDGDSGSKCDIYVPTQSLSRHKSWYVFYPARRQRCGSEFYVLFWKPSVTLKALQRTLGRKLHAKSLWHGDERPRCAGAHPRQVYVVATTPAGTEAALRGVVGGRHRVIWPSAEERLAASLRRSRRPSCSRPPGHKGPCDAPTDAPVGPGRAGRGPTFRADRLQSKSNLE
jgi:hypothetical protein